jgi:hypothetical protein
MGLESNVGRVVQRDAIMDKTTADSEAAMAKIKITKTSPAIALKNIEPMTKFKLIESKSNSIDINVTSKFFLFKIIPSNPIMKREVLQRKHSRSDATNINAIQKLLTTLVKS